MELTAVSTFHPLVLQRTDPKKNHYLTVFDTFTSTQAMSDPRFHDAGTTLKTSVSRVKHVQRSFNYRRLNTPNTSSSMKIKPLAAIILLIMDTLEQRALALSAVDLLAPLKKSKMQDIRSSPGSQALVRSSSEEVEDLEAHQPQAAPPLSTSFTFTFTPPVRTALPFMSSSPSASPITSPTKCYFGWPSSYPNSYGGSNQTLVCASVKDKLREIKDTWHMSRQPPRIDEAIKGNSVHLTLVISSNSEATFLPCT